MKLLIVGKFTAWAYNKYETMNVVSSLQSPLNAKDIPVQEFLVALQNF